MPSIRRSLADEVLRFRLDEEAARLSSAEQLERGGRSARTLLKEGPLRVTIIALAPEGTIAEHHAAGPITVQCLSGRIGFRLEETTHQLEAGDLLSLPAGLRHAVDSDTGGVFLLTVATAPESRGDN